MEILLQCTTTVGEVINNKKNTEFEFEFCVNVKQAVEIGSQLLKEVNIKTGVGC